MKKSKDISAAHRNCKAPNKSHRFFKKVSNKVDRRRNKASLSRGEENVFFHSSNSWDLS